MRTERRKSQRFQINQLIEIDLGREYFIPAEGVNISEEGLLCHTPEAIDPYSRVYMQLTLDGSKKKQVISCEGVVVRCKKNKKTYDTALEFSSIDGSDRKKIHQFIH